jgi:lipoprotein-anchoring transpeptidase ErfK/SrfK
MVGTNLPGRVAHHTVSARFHSLSNTIDMNSRTPWFVFIGALALILLVIGIGGPALVSQAYSQNYADRIYPGVNVYGVDLSGMTVDEASVALRGMFPNPAAQPLTLSDGERTWNRSWADLGIKLDPVSTARLAFQVGREGTPKENRAAQIKALAAGWQVSPIIILPDSTEATAALEALAPEVAIPPVNASLTIQSDGVVPIPAQAGRELDIEATVAALPHAVSVGPTGLALNLLTTQVEPAIGDPGPAQAQIEALLAQPFVLSAYDFLTNFSTQWSVEPTIVASWLTVQEVEDGEGARLAVEAQEDTIHAHLNTLNGQLTTDQVTIDLEKSALQIQAAIEATQHQATVVLAHPPRIHAVQFGETMMSVARTYGFPVWRLLEANPDIDASDLHPGQEIIIPTIDLLFPLPLVADQRIVVDISDQRLYAYANETLVYDFICSTGIESSPTLPGTFQILSKEEEAYASSWDLWMPHFMGVYRSGPDFTNGIHGMPLRNGQQLWWRLGSPASYGCIVIGLEEASELYEWTQLGALVIIRE